MSLKVRGEVVVEEDNWPSRIAPTFEWGETVKGQPECNISAIREIPMGVFLAICGNFFLAEVPIERAIEDIRNILGSPCLAVFVSVVHLLRGGLIEEKHNKARDNR